MEPWLKLRDATRNGIWCPQEDDEAVYGIQFSQRDIEDCLNLNVFTPNVSI